MKRWTAAALFSVFLLAVVMRLLPLLRSLHWGSDFGEYYSLSRALAEQGTLPGAYRGWGVTYPSFPGLFAVNAAFASFGIPVDFTATVLTPVLAGFGVVPLFLLAVRVTGDDAAALVASAFLAVVMVHVYPTSHAIPASLGDVLLLGALLSFVGIRQSPKFVVPLLLAGSAIVMTHHLAAYVLLLAAIASLVLRAILDRTLTIRRIRFELAALVALLAATLAYWALYARPFWSLIESKSPIPPIGLVGAAVFAVSLVPLIIRARRRTPWRFRPRVRSARAATLAAGIAFATVVGIGVAFAVGPVPGTSLRIEAPHLVLFVPMFAFFALSASGRKILDFSREGPDLTAWFLALVLSIVAGALALPDVLIPYRHIEYLAIPLGVMVGAGLRWLSLGADTRRRRAAVVCTAFVLVAGSALSAYPPRAALAGFEEGISPRSVEAALWVRDHSGGLVAGDHRLSTVLFGFGGVDATWDRELRFWHTANLEETLAAMKAVQISGAAQADVEWLAIDADLRQGLQTSPFAPATPLTPSEAAKFACAPFQKTFDSGYAQLYWVNWALKPQCP